MKKIMFNDRYGLTRSVLNREKTQTRRIISQKLLNKIIRFGEDYYNATFDALNENDLFEQYFFIERIEKTPGVIGEIIAVAQAYADVGFGDTTPIIGIDENDMPIIASDAGLYNKMFVRADLMPHKIRITNVRVSRLHEISDEDCIKEGITHWTCRGKEYYGFFDYKKDKFVQHSTARDAFADLIDRVSGKGTWESNPYVFVYDFELI